MEMHYNIQIQGKIHAQLHTHTLLTSKYWRFKK